MEKRTRTAHFWNQGIRWNIVKKNCERERDHVLWICVKWTWASTTQQVQLSIILLNTQVCSRYFAKQCDIWTCPYVDNRLLGLGHVWDDAICNDEEYKVLRAILNRGCIPVDKKTHTHTQTWIFLSGLRIKTSELLSLKGFVKVTPTIRVTNKKKK